MTVALTRCSPASPAPAARPGSGPVPHSGAFPATPGPPRPSAAQQPAPCPLPRASPHPLTPAPAVPAPEEGVRGQGRLRARRPRHGDARSTAHALVGKTQTPCVPDPGSRVPTRLHLLTSETSGNSSQKTLSFKLNAKLCAASCLFWKERKAKHQRHN